MESHSTPARTATASTVEPEHEVLIRRIQNREGSIPKAEREEALLELIKKFQYLIKKIANDVWRKEIGETPDDFQHDTLTTFLELVVEDYIPPRYGGQTTFAPYIQSKLYWKTLYRAQRLTTQRNRAFSVDFTDKGLESNPDRSEQQVPHALREALLANAGNVEDVIVQDMRDNEIAKQLMELRLIADDSRILDDRERFVWNAYFFSPLTVREIGEKIEPKIGTSRVNQLVGQVRQKVLAEYARRRIGRTLAT